MDVTELLGKTLTDVTRNGEEVIFETTETKYKMFHIQDCCEQVWIEDLCGDLEDLVGSPIVMAEEATNNENRNPLSPVPADTWAGLKKDLNEESEYGRDESNTWTFYKLGTNKGVVTMRWCGSSNGYYSESVNFAEESEDRYDY